MYIFLSFFSLNFPPEAQGEAEFVTVAGWVCGCVDTGFKSDCPENMHVWGMKVLLMIGYILGCISR